MEEEKVEGVERRSEQAGRKGRVLETKESRKKREHERGRKTAERVMRKI